MSVAVSLVLTSGEDQERSGESGSVSVHAEGERER